MRRRPHENDSKKQNWLNRQGASDGRPADHWGKCASGTANDNILLEQAHRLFEQLYQRRQLVRLIGLRFSGLVHGNQQIDLFENNIRESQLLQQLDHIRTRFGKNAIQRGSAVHPPKRQNEQEKEGE